MVMDAAAKEDAAIVIKILYNLSLFTSSIKLM